MSAPKKKPTRAEQELAAAEQRRLAPVLHERTRGCAYGSCAMTRPAGAARAVAVMSIHAARASPRRDGRGSITSSRRCARERRRRRPFKRRTKPFSAIVSDASCAGPTSRTGTISSSCSSLTAAGNTPIRHPPLRTSIRDSLNWPPRLGCATRWRARMLVVTAPSPLAGEGGSMLPRAMVGEGCRAATTPHPFESVGTPLCPLPQG